MISLVRSVYRYTDIGSLLRSKFRQLYTDLFKMQTSYFFIQMFRQTIYIDIIFIIKQLNLSQSLVRK